MVAPRALFLLLSALPTWLSAQEKQPAKKVNPLNFRAEKPSRVGASFDVDFLIWNACEDQLQYAYDGSSANATTAVTSEGKVQFPDWKWDRGLKVGCGVYTGYDGWDVFSEYTWFKTSTSGRIDVGDSILRKSWHILNFNNQTTLTQASSSWGLQFNIVEAAIRRQFYVSKRIALLPYLGLKGSSQEQNYKVNYSGTSMTQPGSASMDQHQVYWGIGPRLGLDSSWYLYKKWGLFGRFAATALWEHFQVTRTDTVFNDLESTETITLATKANFSTVKPVLEASVGLQGEYWAWKDKLRFFLRAAYEYQVWFGQNQLIRTNLDTFPGGDLTLQGVTIKGEIEF